MSGGYTSMAHTDFFVRRSRRGIAASGIDACCHVIRDLALPDGVSNSTSAQIRLTPQFPSCVASRRVRPRETMNLGIVSLQRTRRQAPLRHWLDEARFAIHLRCRCAFHGPGTGFVCAGGHFSFLPSPPTGLLRGSMACCRRR